MNDFLSSLRFLLLCRYIQVFDKVRYHLSQQKLILMQIIPNLIPIPHSLIHLILIHPTFNLCFIHLIQLPKISLNSYKTQNSSSYKTSLSSFSPILKTFLVIAISLYTYYITHYFQSFYKKILATKYILFDRLIHVFQIDEGTRECVHNSLSNVLCIRNSIDCCEVGLQAFRVRLCFFIIDGWSVCRLSWVIFCGNMGLSLLKGSHFDIFNCMDLVIIYDFVFLVTFYLHFYLIFC